MRDLILLFLILQSFIIQAQSFSVRTGYEWIKPELVQQELFNSSIIGQHYPTEGYRIGVTCHLPIYKSLGILTEVGYSKGGFDAFRNDYSVKLNQLYVMATPQFSIYRYFSVSAGGILNYNQSKLSRQGSTDPSFVRFNYGAALSASAHFSSFEFGFRYIKYLNPYYNYNQWIIKENSSQYWRITSLFVGYRFWQKSKH